MELQKISSLVWYLMWLMVVFAGLGTWGAIWGYAQDRKQLKR